MSIVQQRKKCIVLVPAYGPIEPGCEQALHELERRGYPTRRVYGYSDIALGRCELASEAYEEGYEEFLWVDTDINFNPDDVEKIRSHGLPLCGGLYARKNGHGFAVMWRNTGVEYQVTFGKDGGLIEVDGVGCGFLHIRREVYTVIEGQGLSERCNRQFGKIFVTHYVPLVVDEPEGRRYMSEDYAFCWRARQAGFKIMVDTSINLLHVGPYGYDWRHVKAWEEAQGKPVLCQV
jgi:hypothetical protein